MTFSWGAILEAIRRNDSDTAVADAFRRAAGLAPLRPGPRGSSGAWRRSRFEADYESLMGQRYGVRL